MAFTVNEFRDLLNILRTKPEWKAELRRELLGEEILELPRLIRELTETVAEMNRRLYRVEEDLAVVKSGVGVLKADVGGLKDDSASLKADVAVLKADVGGLKDDSASLKADVAVLKSDVGVLKADSASLKSDVGVLKADSASLKSDVAVLKTDMATVKGESIERKYRERPFVYFRRIMRKPRTLSDSDVDELLSKALADGVLTEQEVVDVSLLDAVVRGRRVSDDRVAYLAVEVSSKIDDHDVERAARRAKLLEKIPDMVAVPVVAGEVVTPEGIQAAKQSAVWTVTNGHAVDAVEP